MWVSEDSAPDSRRASRYPTRARSRLPTVPNKLCRSKTISGTRTRQRPPGILCCPVTRSRLRVDHESSSSGLLRPIDRDRKSSGQKHNAIARKTKGSRQKKTSVRDKARTWLRSKETRRLRGSGRRNKGGRCPVVSLLNTLRDPITHGSTGSSTLDPPAEIDSSWPSKTVEDPKTDHSPDSFTESEAKASLMRHQDLKRSENEERTKAMEKYQADGDASVFAPFMAPFTGGPDQPDLGVWIWDRSVERWRREHELNGKIVWGPTVDSFI